jgi:Domain of unknown function (DUF2703)
MAAMWVEWRPCACSANPCDRQIQFGKMLHEVVADLKAALAPVNIEPALKVTQGASTSKGATGSDELLIDGKSVLDWLCVNRLGIVACPECTGSHHQSFEFEGSTFDEPARDQILLAGLSSATSALDRLGLLRITR